MIKLTLTSPNPKRNPTLVQENVVFATNWRNCFAISESEQMTRIRQIKSNLLRQDGNLCKALAAYAGAHDPTSRSELNKVMRNAVKTYRREAQCHRQDIARIYDADEYLLGMGGEEAESDSE